MLVVTFKIIAISKIKNQYNRLILILKDNNKKFIIAQYKLKVYRHPRKKKTISKNSLNI